VVNDGMMDVDQFLAQGSVGRTKIFTASCVERMAQLFTGIVGRSSGRESDVERAIQCLDQLWEVDSRTQWADTAAAFNEMPELAGDEEPPGVLAYAYDAAACLYYGAEYRRSLDSSNVRYCANHALNSAGFVTDLLDDGIDRLRNELDAQARDIRELQEVSDDAVERVIETLRNRSREMSLRMLSDVLHGFS
jgi:hypothetical protein